MAKRSRQEPADTVLDKTSAKVFHALASDPRRMMLAHLAGRTLTAGEIAARFDMAKPSISQHLSILENAGLIEGDKKGQFIHYRLLPETLQQALQSFLAITMAGTAEAAMAEQSPAEAKPKSNRQKKTPTGTPKDEETNSKTPKRKGSVEKTAKPAAPAPQQMGLLDLLGMDG